MDKRQRWQRLLIVGVIFLTLYNILPTVFFYTKPLKSPVNEQAARAVSTQIMERINHLEEEAEEWLISFCKLLHIKPQSITLDPKSPQHISLIFKDASDASKFRKFLPRAGSLVPFAPMQLSLYPTDSPKAVVIQRKIPVHFEKEEQDNYFQFSQKFDSNQEPAPLYRALIFDRVIHLCMAIGGPSEPALLLESLGTNAADSRETSLKLSQDLLSFVKIFGESSVLSTRYFASYSQTEEGQETLIPSFLRHLTGAKDQTRLERINLQSEAQSLQAKGAFLETSKKQRLEELLKEEQLLTEAEHLVKKHKSHFVAGKTPWNYSTLSALLEESYLASLKSGSQTQTLKISEYNPFIQEVVIDWTNEALYLTLHSDLLAFKEEFSSKAKQFLKDQVNQAIYNQIAYFGRLSGEEITPFGNSFQIKLSQVEEAQSFLALRLSRIASLFANEIADTLSHEWNPKHPDLVSEAFPIWTYETYLSLPAHQRKLGLLIYAPMMYNEMPEKGFRTNSLYVVAKGLDKILQKLQETPSSEDSKAFFKDFNRLKTLLQKNGFFSYPASTPGSLLATNKAYANDVVFEIEDFYLPVLKASRENFEIHGTQRFAVLELSNVEQRILTQNKIENHIHEDLLKWRDDYASSQLALHGAAPFDVPTPTKNILLSNLKMSIKKYFRGDERKVLHWGLDLSGGKTVQIQLRDQNNRPVTGDTEIKQGIDELHQRVNKMGVSEVSIRREGNFITLDFPGSQGVSAEELIKASTMYFHIVNEKFGPKNLALSKAVNQFLTDVWNEAVVTSRKSAEEVNQIAWRHLYGNGGNSSTIQPRSEAAQLLYEEGLRLANPLDSTSESTFNDAVSSLAIMRGEDFTKWHGQNHPLMVIFHHFALEGSQLKNVTAGYDPAKGNFLLFEIKGKETLKSGEKVHPREDLYAWTSQFSKDKIAGTPNGVFSGNDGYRMAVILNGSVITAPTLSYPIRDGGSIEGSFTQREVQQLEADLKAGSLSFTPHILSEKNISPELGASERFFGILSTAIALILVIGAMVSYYRFGGVVASVAVILNLLIMWATLQNIHATLTLASIAGAILTLGMAVDANVLVFERIREEFAVSKRLSQAINTGYKKAWSAILDSNVTTVIAALILLQFDSGPIKGFALTLIIGIASSMFTALFMTRVFFNRFVQNPKNTALKMSQFIKITRFPFLKYAKIAALSSAVFVLVGGAFFIKQRHSMLGMDFTGGYSLNLDLPPSPYTDYRALVEQALLKQGASPQDFQIRVLAPQNHLRLFLSKAMQQKGKPFFEMPLQNEQKEFTYLYQVNPRISWVVNSLEASSITLSPDALKSLDQNWNEISGQLSDSMRSSALIGFSIALIGLMIYITIRFEWKYALAATACLGFDLVLTLCAIALLNALGLPLQIDLNAIAALMTIIGYSLNDTIIIFDRIREDALLMRKSSFREVVNHALNVTLSRTIMTSGTTLLVLLPLVLLGGSTIFGFSLIMIIGIVLGTLSSLFIAAPLLHFLHQRHFEKEKKAELQITS